MDQNPSLLQERCSPFKGEAVGLWTLGSFPPWRVCVGDYLKNSTKRAAAAACMLVFVMVPACSMRLGSARRCNMALSARHQEPKGSGAPRQPKSPATFVSGGSRNTDTMHRA